jgi:hypothetical protein
MIKKTDVPAVLFVVLSLWTVAIGAEIVHLIISID